MAQHPGTYTFKGLARIMVLLPLLALYSNGFGQGRPTFIPVASEALSNSFVRCFYQDRDGYMWLGTTDGLVKYDGTSTRIYNHDPDDKTSICHNNINVIIEDLQHRLWIGTAQGLCMYNAELDRFINIDSIPGIKNHLNNRYITAMSFDHEGKLWIGTHGGGVNIYNPTTMTFDYILDNQGVSAAATLTNYISSMLSVDDLIWCGTKGGIRLFNATQKKIAPLNFSQGEFPVRQVSQIVSDKARNIWLTTVNGEIHKIIPGNGYYSYKKLVAGDSLFSGSWNNTVALCRDEKGNFWIGGESSGLNYLDTKTNKITRFLAEENNVNTLPTNSIRSVYIDHSGSTWIGTFNRGAFLIDKSRKKFDPYRKGELKAVDLAVKDVRGFAEDRNGNIWIAFDGAGVRKLNSRSNQLESCEEVNSRLHNKYLTSIINDRHGKLWIGTRAKGVFCVDPVSGQVTHYSLTSNGFGDDKVYCLYEDKKGVIWAGSSGSGLFYLDNLKQRFINLREKDAHSTIPSTAYVTSLQEDADGILWVGTMYGLYSMELQPTGAYHYGLFIQDSKEGSLSSNGVQYVYEDHKKNLWVGTTDNGLNVKYKGEKGFRAFRKSDGLPSNTIRSMVMDFNGKLWISGNMGLSRLDPSTNNFINYTRENGLTSNIFYNNASLRTSSGELFFGSNNGFDAFYPDSINDVSYDPVVHLTDLKINNQSVGIDTENSPLSKHIRFTSSIELSYDQRSFAIDFAALQYGTSFSSEYCYKLEGFDNDWNCIGANHSATYTNLDPGDYEFFVRASDGQGGWSEHPARLAITIHPMPWKSWWAITIYSVLITAIAFFFIRFQIERERMKHQLTLERLAREREHELSESKTQFFTNVSHELRTPLSLILMPLESLSDGDVPPTMRERIHTAYKNTRKMMRLVNELMDFNKIESGNLKLNLQPGDLVDYIVEIASAFNGMAEKRKINFSVRTELLVIKGVFDRDKLERILVNILSNAFKFTRDGGEIKVIVNARSIPVGSPPVFGRCLELNVVDNGIGISSEEITRIFDKFFQAKSASQISNPGTGIGLALTKALVELHKGTIKAESSPDNETRFTIILPIDPVVHNVDEMLEVPLDILPDATQPDPVDHDQVVIAKNASCDKPEILLAEDNDELRKYLSTELQRHYHVLEARDGQEAFEIAKRKCPDLIISDILMPNKTGIELCRAMKSEIKTSHIPFILLTAKATVEEQIAGIETGADLYITKPFSIRYLMTHVRNVIDSRQKLYSHYSHDVYLMPSKTTSNEIDQAFLQRVIDHILEHIQDTQLGVDSIAEVFNLSRVQVYRKIKALTGKTAVEFIRIVRLKKALELMETKKFTLSEIAYQSGFNSASYFTRSFKDEYGKAPSEYLEQSSVRR